MRISDWSSDVCSSDLPGQESEVARGLRRSPLYEILKARGAVYGSKNGWERPNWFAPAGVEPVDRPGFTGQNWKPHVAEEHRAVREGVALLDQSRFSKFELRGPGALAALQRRAVPKLYKPVRSVQRRVGKECGSPCSSRGATE